MVDKEAWLHYMYAQEYLSSNCDVEKCRITVINLCNLEHFVCTYFFKVHVLSKKFIHHSELHIM